MPRKSKKPAIIEALSLKGADPIKVADSFGVQRSYVYHLDKKRRLGENPTPHEGFSMPSSPLPQGSLFSQESTSSLRRYGGSIAEEYLRELQGYQGVQMYKEMGNHPIVAAVLQAIKMTIRRIQWHAVAPSSGREAEVDFLNQCMNDMEHTWSDYIDEALSMLQYGFAPFEKVLKLRKGNNDRPGPKLPPSRYSDGKIGWKKFVLIGQDTLSQGNAWIYDLHTGDTLGLNQQPPPGGVVVGYKQIPIPIPLSKLVLFRTTSYKNNPEGISVLRPMYRCFSDDTEILTRNGWMGRGQISAGDEIATLNPKTNSIEYQATKEVPEYDFDGELVHASNRNIDQLVTPNHRMWVCRPHKNEYEFIEASDCGPNVKFQATAKWDAPDIETVRIGDKEINADLWFEFMGYWLSEGSSGKYGREYESSVCQKKEPTRSRIREIVNQLPWNSNEWTDNDDKTRFQFTRKELWEHLSPLGKSVSRTMPKYLLNGSARQISIMLDAYWKGDGTLAGNPNKWAGTKVIYTASRSMADSLMEAILKTGGRPAIRWQPGTGFSKPNTGVWVVTIGKEFHSAIADWENIPYTGKVWCVSTPNGIVYTRRNGKCSWSGNSYYYATNMEEVEAISLERMGSGFPVIYLGDDISKGASDSRSEIHEYRKIVRNIRVDEQMGLVIPHPKMGAGAREGQGVLLEFANAQGNSNVNFSAVIERHEKRMAMVGLAQFIHLGMGQFGGGSLADVTTDFFQLAVSAWADSIRDTINRAAVIPLLALNKMDIQDPVMIEHTSVGNPDLKVVGDYINQTVGARVIEPDDQLEDAVRRLAGLPEKDPTTTRLVMSEIDGDGGLRKDRDQKNDSLDGNDQPTGDAPPNQRNMRPKAKTPNITKTEIRKPKRT